MATPIRVLLRENVDNLGDSGDVVRVRPGFARNYLIPRGLAMPATPANLTRVEELKRAAAHRADQERAESEELKTKLEAVSVKIVRAVGEENKMYGSVTSKDIEEAYREQGIEIDRRRIQLSDPIKELGLAEVPVKLKHDIRALLRVEVIKQT